MGAGVSVPPSREEALAAGFTEEEIEEYISMNDAGQANADEHDVPEGQAMAVNDGDRTMDQDDEASDFFLGSTNDEGSGANSENWNGILERKPSTHVNFGMVDEIQMSMTLREDEVLEVEE